MEVLNLRSLEEGRTLLDSMDPSNQNLLVAVLNMMSSWLNLTPGNTKFLRYNNGILMGHGYTPYSRISRAN